MQRRILTTIMLLALAGIAVSLYSFLHNQGFASGEFCSIGETLNCDVVNKGPYSKIYGIPVSLIGVAGYLFLGLGAFLKLRQPKDKGLTLFLVLASLAGFAFSLYLTGIEAFVLETWCLLCLTSQLIILLALVGSIWVWYNEKV